MKALSAVVLSTLAAAQVAPTPSSAQLAVRRIVLYKHGVGYFEREGKVSGDASVPLSFKAAQMKDVLKSLFAVDLDGGRIATVIYDSKDPIEKQLEDILFRVPEQAALTQLLTQLKGARIEVAIGSRTVTGRVLGIEPVQRAAEHGGPVTVHKLVLLTDAGSIEALELLDASGVTILDEAVRRDLARMLEIYSKARYADRKVVTLSANGTGERRVRAGYIIETPIWKTSYRLLLEKDAPPLLQGWAIVENRTDEDWTDVQLSFVAGAPLSFVLDLYTSYYPARPVIGMQIAAAQAGRFEELARKDKGPADDRPAARFRALAPSAEAAPDASGLGTFSDVELAERSLEPAAQGVALGELFAYEAKGPVSIRQGQAALVPILLERLPKGERTLWFRRAFSPNPAHAIVLDNTTALTLEKGPVTVFEGAACLGEAMLARTLGPGQHEVLPYALESSVRVEIAVEGSARPVTKGVLQRGVLTLVRTQVLETTYRLKNETSTARRLLLDHARTGGYELMAPKPVEEPTGHARFGIELAAGADQKLVVREEQIVSEEIAIQNENTERLRFFAEQRFLSEAARAVLSRVADAMAERATLDGRARLLTEERGRLERDQENLRKNIQVLRDSPEEKKLREQYVGRLTQAMARTDEIDRELRDTQNNRQQIDARIAATLREFVEG